MSTRPLSRQDDLDDMPSDPLLQAQMHSMGWSEEEAPIVIDLVRSSTII